MKTISVQAIITSIRAKVDRSLGLSMSTPELSDEDKVEFMKLQGRVIMAVLTPLDEKNVPAYKIDRAVENKTPSQRIRGVLYILWEQLGMKGDFNDFYREQMEKIIDSIKAKLD